MTQGQRVTGICISFKWQLNVKKQLASLKKILISTLHVFLILCGTALEFIHVIHLYNEGFVKSMFLEFSKYLLVLII